MNWYFLDVGVSKYDFNGGITFIIWFFKFRLLLYILFIEFIV